MSSTRKITLKSSDGKAFEVDEAVALESQTIKHMIDDDCADSVIPLPNVTSKILAKVFEYCKKHVEAAVYDDKFKEWDICDFECMCCYLGSFRPSGIKAWDAEFVKVDRATLSKLVLAANFLNIESLLDLTCQTVRDTVKGKTREEIGRFFNIKNDFIPEEEEEDSRDNYWVIEC